MQDPVPDQRLANGVEATTEYTLRAPSPPYLEAPIIRFDAEGSRGSDAEEEDVTPNPTAFLDLEPTKEAINTVGLSASDLDAIVGDRTQAAFNGDRHGTWVYEDRRGAHAILDFLYAGPSSIARDHGYLAEEGITLILVANESRMPGQKLRSLEAAGEALNIDIVYIDPVPAHQLVSSFNETVQVINHHMLAAARNSLAHPPEAKSQQAKVLVVCETGNDRSGLIVSSYIMAMYLRDMFDATRYVLSRRLSCGFDENGRRALQTWGDILQARSSVTAQKRSSPSADSSRMAKRGFAQTIEIEMEDSDGSTIPQSQNPSDIGRFMGRESFTPFRDSA